RGADVLRAERRPGAVTREDGISPAPHLRVARPTDDLDAAVAFYRDGLGFEVLSRFADHDGYDGVMLGQRGAGYHLELTRRRGHRAGRAPDAEHLLVLYLPERAAWERAVARIEA